MRSETSIKLANLARWVALAPGAIAAAWVGWLLINLLGRFSLGFVGVEADSFFGQFYFVTAGHAAMGIAFVYAGVFIAPKNRMNVAYILGVLGVFSGGVTIVPAILGKNAWAIWGSICVIFGTCAIVYSIHRGEIDLGDLQ